MTHEERQKALKDVLYSHAICTGDEHGEMPGAAQISYDALTGCVAIPREEYERLSKITNAIGDGDIAKRYEELVDLSRRFYNADGTFTEMEPDEVIRRRKAAAQSIANIEQTTRARCAEVVREALYAKHSILRVRVEMALGRIEKEDFKAL